MLVTNADTVIRTRPRFTSTVVVLASLCVAIAVGRLRFIHDLPDWDVATYALIGNEMAHGKQLYSDAWDMKPPAIFASFAAAEWITRGSHEWSAYLLSVVASITTTIAIYFAGASLNRAAGLWAAALWTCVSLQPAMGGYLPNTEAFINACLAIAIAASLRRRFIVAGVALAVATLFKQVAIAPAIALAVWMVVAKRTRIRDAIIMLAIIPLVWILVFTYFSVTSRGELFYQTNFVYPRFYAGNVACNLLAAFRPSQLFPRAMVELLPLVMIGLVGLLTSGLRSLSIALFIGMFVAVAMPGHFFEHYLQLWFVPLAIAGAGAITSLRRPWIGAIVCIGLLILQSHWWLRSPRARAAAMHPASFFLNVADTGTEIRDLLGEDETMFVWCDETQLYWLASKRPPATGLWRTHMTEGPMSAWLTERTLAQLQQHPPDLIVTWAGEVDQLDHPMIQWIARNYVPLPDNAKRLPLALHARRGSDLARRTHAALP